MAGQTGTMGNFEEQEGIARDIKALAIMLIVTDNCTFEQFIEYLLKDAINEDILALDEIKHAFLEDVQGTNVEALKI